MRQEHIRCVKNDEELSLKFASWPTVGNDAEVLHHNSNQPVWDNDQKFLAIYNRLLQNEYKIYAQPEPDEWPKIQETMD